MIHIECSQGSPEWYFARIGIPTSSEFDKILTPTGKRSTQADKYANRLLAEIILKEPLDMRPPTFAMERGTMLEADAAASYEFQEDVTTTRAGFFMDDNKRYGCSVDRLVWDKGLLEIKCPLGDTHMANLLSGKLDDSYKPQVQGQLLVTGKEWNDWYSYFPGLPPSKIRVERDEAYIALLVEALDEFHDLLGSKYNRLVELGHIDPVTV